MFIKFLLREIEMSENENISKQKVKNAILDYLRTRLQDHRLQGLGEGEELRPNKMRIECSLKPDALGIFRHVLASCFLRVEISFEGAASVESIDGRFRAWISLRYEHVDGGINGMDLNFSLQGTWKGETVSLVENQK